MLLLKEDSMLLLKECKLSYFSRWIAFYFLIVVISIVDRFDGCLMDVIRPFFFYTKIFLHSFITFLDMVCNFMKIDTISGSFYAVVTLQLPIKEQGFILQQILRMLLPWEAAKQMLSLIYHRQSPQWGVGIGTLNCTFTQQEEQKWQK